jgi:hypothetical protein
MDLLEMGWGWGDWIGLAQERDKRRALVNAVMNLRVPYNAGKLSSGYMICVLSSSSQFHRISYLVILSAKQPTINETITMVIHDVN